MEISTQEEYAKTCGFLYTTLRRKDKKEPSTAQWIYRHIEEANLAFLLIGLKLECEDKHILYSDLKQLLNTTNLWDAIDQAKLFQEIATAQVPFPAGVLDRFDHPTVVKVSKHLLEQWGDPQLLETLILP